MSRAKELADMLRAKAAAPARGPHDSGGLGTAQPVPKEATAVARAA